MNKAIQPRQAIARCTIIVQLAMLLAGLGFVAIAGCAAEDKNPKTVTEFLKQPRVGELPK